MAIVVKNVVAVAVVVVDDIDVDLATVAVAVPAAAATNRFSSDTSVTEVKDRPLRIVLVTSDYSWFWYLLMLNVCVVCVVLLSQTNSRDSGEEQRVIPPRGCLQDSWDVKWK